MAASSPEAKRRAAERKRQYRLEHPDRVRATKCKWREANLEKDRARNRRKHRENPGINQRAGWRYNNLPQPTRPRPDACENCGREAWLELLALALDHDHTTGAFRGWLCRSCNTGLGLLGDNREGLLKALAYLDRK